MNGPSTTTKSGYSAAVTCCKSRRQRLEVMRYPRFGPKYSESSQRTSLLCLMSYLSDIRC
ncbi:hypothetical protein GW17_00020326 [Ensete ventricosum]|nr:hypothetical protein GW17_00020326 [Ensete ventricosum]RZS19088.1 hypothetical protein BHM03_00051435 [Ensete ventricosum]